MYYVYILKSELDGKHYIGHTSNLTERIQKHNKGVVRSTRHRRPLKLVTSATCSAKKTAMRVENYLKSLKKSQVAIEWIKHPSGPLAQLVRASGS